MSAEFVLALLIAVVFVIIVGGGIMRLFRRAGPVKPNLAECIKCDFEAPAVCKECINGPAHENMEYELPTFQPDYAAVLDDMNGAGLM